MHGANNVSKVVRYSTGRFPRTKDVLQKIKIELGLARRLSDLHDEGSAALSYIDATQMRE